MAYNRSQVRNLLNASELELFESSLATQVKALSERQLRSNTGRVRTLRNKFQDLLRRQKLATRNRTGSKLGTSGAANERTERKASVMAEVLARFEARMDQLEAAQRAAAGKKIPAKKAPAKKTAAKKTTAKKATAKKATAKKATAKKATAKKATAKKTVAKNVTSKLATATQNAAKKTAAKKAPAKKSGTAHRKGRPAAVVLREALEKKRAAGNSGAPVIDPPVSDKAPSKPPQGSNAAVEPLPGRKAPRIWESGSQRIEGHIGTQVRRAQGKRDSRG